MSGDELDQVFLRGLLSCLARAAQEVAIARGRLRRGHLTARSHLVDARGHLQRIKLELELLTTVADLDEALDVLVLRRWEWAIRLAGEDMALARTMLTRSKRQRVTHVMLEDAQRVLERAREGLRELTQRAWGPLRTRPRRGASRSGRGANRTRRTPRRAGKGPST